MTQFCELAGGFPTVFHGSVRDRYANFLGLHSATRDLLRLVSCLDQRLLYSDSISANCKNIPCEKLGFARQTNATNML